MNTLYLVIRILLYCICFIGVIRIANWIIGKIIVVWNEQKKSKAAFYTITKKLNEQLQLAKFANDWKQIQEVNLKLIWLKAKNDWDNHINKASNESKDELTLKLNYPEKELTLPNTWSLDNMYCYRFANEIIAAYRNVLANNEYPGKYKPDYILPVPKEYIIKSILYILDFIDSNGDKSEHSIMENEELKKNLGFIKALLYVSFIDTGNILLSKDPKENLTEGNQILEGQNNQSTFDELSLIDWKS